MAKFALFVLVLLPCVFSDERARFFPQATAAGGGGAFGNQHDRGQQSNEVHNDKQFALNFGKQQGSSNQQSHDRGQQMGAAGFGAATAPVVPGWGSGWPSFPQGWGAVPQGWGVPPVPQGWGRPPVPQGWGGPVGR